jgi:osmoprotectant transport system ATP-binding protein
MMLAHPADGFAAEFLGADRLLLRLSLFPVSALPAQAAAAAGVPLAADATLRDALAAMLAAGATALPLAAGGSIALADLLAFAAAG